MHMAGRRLVRPQCVGSVLVLWLTAGCVGLTGQTQPSWEGPTGGQTQLSNGPLAQPAVVPPEMQDRLARMQSADPSSTKPTPPTLPGRVVRDVLNEGTAFRAVAYVNNQPITEGELREAANQRLSEVLAKPEHERSAAMRAIRRAELQRMIERELILHDMEMKLAKTRPKALEELRKAAASDTDKRLRELKREKGITSDDDLRNLLAMQGLTLEGIRRQIERNFMMMQYVQGRISTTVNQISLAQLEQYFNDHRSEFRTEDRVKWQDLFIDASKHPDRQAARRHAESILQRARAGEDFAELVRQYDDGLKTVFGVGEKPGEILPPQVAPVVWALKAGEVGPLVEMSSGYHIVRVTERVYAGTLNFYEPKTQMLVRRKMQSEIAEREYREIVDELRRKAVIRIVADDL